MRFYVNRYGFWLLFWTSPVWIPLVMFRLTARFLVWYCKTAWKGYQRIMVLVGDAIEIGKGWKQEYDGYRAYRNRRELGDDVPENPAKYSDRR
jgi:hypothetical protein